MALWRSQSVQVVWFLTGSELNVDKFYQGMFGTEPDRVERNKAPNPMNPFIGMASGIVQGLSVTFQLQPGRVDLIIQPDGNAVNDNLPPTLDSEWVLSWLEHHLTVAADRFPVAIRVAIVCNFLKMAATAEEARTEISALVGLDEKINSYSDFLFQLNRRAFGAETGVELNRLLRWASMVFQSVVFNLPSHVSILTTPINVEHHAAAIAVDINTVLGTRAFESSEQVSIFKDMLTELRRLGSDRTPFSLMSEGT